MSSTFPNPSIDLLRQLVTYDPDTGVFLYRHVPWMRACRNARVTGKPAFTRVHRQGYRTACIGGRHVFAHRAAIALTHGAWPEGDVDHINHDPTDNRIANLRVVTKTENTRNLSKSRNNTSGVTGVHRVANSQKWRAYIRVNKKLHNLGTFGTFAEAVRTRRAAEVRFGFHPNHGIDAIWNR